MDTSIFFPKLKYSFQFCNSVYLLMICTDKIKKKGLYVSIFVVEHEIWLKLERPFKLNGMVREDETPIHKSVREALVNCLANADFFLSRGIVIEKFPDKIVMKKGDNECLEFIAHLLKC